MEPWHARYNDQLAQGKLKAFRNDPKALLTSLQRKARTMQRMNKTKEKRIGKSIEVMEVQYEQAFPRFTICSIAGKSGDGTRHIVHGVALRSRRDPENQTIGERVSFTRALNAL